MYKKTVATLCALLITLFAATPLMAGSWEGTVKLGGIILDEEGDLSAVQETYNIHDGFNVSQILFRANPGSRDFLKLDLREINLDARQGDFLFRRPGLLQVDASYDQNRQVFDADRAVTSERKDFKVGARVTPARWLHLSGHYNHMNRDGSRLSYPAGTASALGTGYDYALNTGGVGAEVRKGRRGFALKYRVSDFADDLNPDADRTGQVVSARMFGPCYLYPKLTHMVRAAYGVSELPNRDVQYTLMKFQYTGAVRPARQVQVKYNFDAQRVDDEATDQKTDRFENAVDATFYHGNGSVYAGYAYETNDDDDQLTAYHSWRAGTTFRNDFYTAKVRYAGRVKRDEEDLTLLKDIEASRFRVDVEVRPVTGLNWGFGVNVRDRQFPDIDVESRGKTYRTDAGYRLDGWGGLSGTYSYTEDQYTDRAGNYEVQSNVVTARVDFERIRNLRLSSGLTYLDIGDDLDIEKSILFFESMYTVRRDLHLEVKYNVYNYDDFILLDRYYTANVVWFNVAYDLHGE